MEYMSRIKKESTRFLNKINDGTYCSLKERETPSNHEVAQQFTISCMIMSQSQIRVTLCPRLRHRPFEMSSYINSIFQDPKHVKCWNVCISVLNQRSTILSITKIVFWEGFGYTSGLWPLSKLPQCCKDLASGMKCVWKRPIHLSLGSEV